MNTKEDVTLYEVLTPEKIAALIAGRPARATQPAQEQDAEPAYTPGVEEAPVAEAFSLEEESGEAAFFPEESLEADGEADAAFAEEADAAQDGAPEQADAFTEPLPEQVSAFVAGAMVAEEGEDVFLMTPGEEEPRTITVIDVRFRDGGKSYYFDPRENDVRTGDGVIVETARGVEFGDVSRGCHEIPASQVVGTLKAIDRVATEQDKLQRDKNQVREKDAYGVCMRKVQEHGLDMKLVDVEYSFNGSKIIFYFTADGRVDFRELVKDLAGVFKTRIELRQIGVRDEAKMLGGLGSCGRPVCCKQFLPDFQPVSIKMAKEQSLSLSPTKISGICGRLMCCLKYEQDTYETMRKRMPRIGKEVMSPDGQGTVMENNVITEKTRLKMVLPDGTLDVRWYPFEELSLTDAPRLEPTPRAPRPEHISRRERVLQEQKERKEAEAKAAEAASAATPDAQGEESQEDAAKRKRPRRRRHRGGGKGAPNAAQNESGGENSGEVTE